MPGGKIDILVSPDLTGFEGKVTTGLRASTSGISKAGLAIGGAIAAGVGVAAVGLKQAITLGIDYQNNLNQIQAVSGATGEQMAAVSARAVALGNDLSLPATSAADAAQAMLELAKGGLSVDQAMQAAKGTLQLAAAAQISGAQAAEIQANALNSFGLSASSAGHVADVLANTANQSSGDITDFAQALSQVGAVAHQFGVSIEDTSTALGLLANAGIKGSDAGTLLKTALTQLAAPSKPAAAAIQDLGRKVFDAQGKFVGLASLMSQLHDASARMTQQQFAQATATVFGTDAVRLAGVAAQDTSADWTKMSDAVGRSGGAADVAAAQMKGLGGAVQGFQSQLETVQLEVFQQISPVLERTTRAATGLLASAGDTTIKALQTGVKTAQTYGPAVAAALRDKATEVATGAEELVKPIVSGLRDATLEGVAIVVSYARQVGQAYTTVAQDLHPVAVAVGEVIAGVDKAGGPLRATGAALTIVGGAAKIAAGAVKPVADVVAEVVHLFGELPGPVQSAALALVALKVGPSILGSLKNAFSGTGSAAGDGSAKTSLFGRAVSGLTAPVRAAASVVGGATNTVRQFAGEMAVQRSLAEATGQSVGRLGSAVNAFNTSTVPAVAAARSFAEQTSAIKAGAAAAGAPIGTFSAALGTLVERSPALSAMKDSFTTASEGAQRFGGLAGTAAAAGTGLKLAAGGLVGALGGPFGIAVAGASLGLGLLASHQEAAAKAAAEQKQAVSDLAGTLDKTTGAITEQTRQQQAQKDASNGVSDAAERQHIALSALLDAQTGNADATASVNRQLRDQSSQWLHSSTTIDQMSSSLQEAGLTFNDFNEVAVGNQAALSKVTAGIGKISETSPDAADALGVLLQQVQKNAGDFSLLGGAIGGANDNLSEAQRQVDQTAQAMGTSTTTAASLINAMNTLSDSTSSVADKTSALKSALDELHGGQIDLDAAQSTLNGTFTDFQQTLKDSAQQAGVSVDQLGQSLVGLHGSIDTSTKAGQQLQSFVHGLSGDMADVATQTFNVSKQAGDSLPQSFKKVEEATAATRAQFIAIAESMGISATAANTLADKYGLIPSQVATLVTTQGTAPQVQQEVQGVIDKINATPDQKSVTVHSITNEAAAALQAIGFQVVHLPNGQVEIGANIDQAQGALNTIIARINASSGTVRINAVSTHGVQVPQAAGGLVEAWAAGGMRPMRGGYAQIVPPNALRIIGDRIRDDEAYIPVNASSRSQGILTETARRMGYALIRAYAAGGIAAHSGSTPLVPVAGPTINNNVTVSRNEDVQTVAEVVASRTAWQLRNTRR
jgi:TP901 family phage tail tape measure protein